MIAASAAAVEAAQKELGCDRYQWRHLIWSDDYCVKHPGDGADLGWTDRGCPVAVRVADAVVEAQGDEAADVWRHTQNINHLRMKIREQWPALAKALNDWQLLREARDA